MSNRLIDDFINSVDEVKDIDSNEKVSALGMMIPSAFKKYPDAEADVISLVMLPNADVVGVPVDFIIKATPEQRMNEFKDIVHNLKSLSLAYNDLINNGEEAIDRIFNAIGAYAEDIGIKLPECDNRMIKAFVLLSDTFAVLTELCRFMSITYNMSYDVDSDSVVNATPTVTSDDIDDKEDEHLAEMLMNEFMGATDGEPFTNEELYGTEEETKNE